MIASLAHGLLLYRAKEMGRNRVATADAISTVR